LDAHGVQYRENIAIVVEIAIVESEHNRVRREGGTTRGGSDAVLHRNEAVVSGKILQLPAKQIQLETFDPWVP
jgi:hypothetical protein